MTVKLHLTAADPEHPGHEHALTEPPYNIVGTWLSFDMRNLGDIDDCLVHLEDVAAGRVPEDDWMGTAHTIYFRRNDAYIECEYYGPPCTISYPDLRDVLLQWRAVRA